MIPSIISISTIMLALIILFFGFGLGAIAQTSTTSVFLPIVGSQTLMASQVREDKGIKTLVVECPDGTEPSKCGFPTPVTITAGPSTLGLTTIVQNTLTVNLKCDVEGSSKADCIQVYTGPASLMASTATGDDASKTTTWTSSATLDSGNVAYLPVTITAGIKSTAASKTGAAAAAPTAFGQILVAGLVANLAAYL